jgi:hypothetical protein
MAFPTNYLPSNSQPWGREVQKRIELAETAISRNERNGDARDTQLASAFERLNATVLKSQEALNKVLTVEEQVYYPGTTEIDGANIRANTIAANKISAGELTGFTVKTGYTGNQRVELNSSNIAFLDSNNNSAGTISASVYGASQSALDIQTSSGGAGLFMTNGLATLSGYNGSNIQLGTGAEGNIGISTNTTNGGIVLSADYITLSGDTSISLIDGDVASNGRITAGNYFTSLGLVGSSTTGASINSAGSIIRTSSSARYKQDIEDATFEYEDILALEPKTFRLKDEAAQNDNARRYAGFIAEDIAGTPLDVFVFYRTNEDGEQEPDGIHYPELTSALLSAIKHQDGLIKSLEARLEALESKV